jgi:hypothetical protein
MIFWNKFCGIVFILLIFSHYSPAQSATLPALHNTFFLKNTMNSSGSLVHFTSPLFIVSDLQNVKHIIPADFYTCNIGFFCKKELLIQKATKIPLRFRLGSLQQCNYYEGKKP